MHIDRLNNVALFILCYNKPFILTVVGHTSLSNMSAKNISFLTSLSVFTQVIDGTVEPGRVAPVDEVVALLAQELNRPGITLNQLKKMKIYWIFFK